MGMKAIRWGILSTGNMASTFARDLCLAPGAEIRAVASRDMDKAERFGDELGIPNRHDSYEALAADPEVDVVYVATPNSLHKDHTMMCLEAGKAVLCEKPFAMDAAEARAMIDCARDRGLFLMEAMWTRFVPLMAKVRELLAGGSLGEVRVVTADFGFRAEGAEMTEILMSPAYGGGSMMDVGVYPLSLASMILGAPSQVAALAHVGETGVDEQAGVLLGYAGGALALLHSAIRTATPQEATIMGAQRRVRIHAPFWCATKMTVFEEDDAVDTVEAGYEGRGYQFEAMEVMDCLREGHGESAVMPLDETLQIAETVDAILGQIHGDGKN